MEKIQQDAPIEQPGDETPRPWVRAIFSGMLFGGLGAAAMHWLGYHSTSLPDRIKGGFGRKWTSAVAGAASATVAMYGTLRADDAAERRVFKEEPADTPGTKVRGESVRHEQVIASPGQRSL